MSRIMNYLLKQQENQPEEQLQGNFEDYLAPESELPADYQALIDREVIAYHVVKSWKDYADKDWWKQQDADPNKPF